MANGAGGAQSEPLCCSQSPKLQMPLHGRANPYSKVCAWRTSTSARLLPTAGLRAGPEPWHRGPGAVIGELHGGAARGAGTATATGPSGSHDGREKGRGEQGQGRNGGRGKSNGRPRTKANLWQGALASGVNLKLCKCVAVLVCMWVG